LKAWQTRLSSLKANIENVNADLIFMGVLEEFRDLSILEWNFRALLQEKYSSLLKQIYWKQRGIIKWVKFGDEGTKFFHANATIKKRRNLITSLADNNGAIHSSHHIKAKILFVRPSRTGLVHQIHLKCFLI
jgi:hypothetical protein